MKHNVRKAKIGKNAPALNFRMIERAQKLRIGRWVVPNMKAYPTYFQEACAGQVGTIVKLRDSFFWDAVVRFPGFRGRQYFGVKASDIRIIKVK